MQGEHETRLTYASAQMQRIAERCLSALINRGWVNRADLKVLRETSREYRAAVKAAEEG